jgi:hypothetical protein
MLASKELSRLLSKDGLELNEEDLQSIAQTLLSLAKIEYEIYLQQKPKPIHGQFQEPLEIGLTTKKIAS